jgi:hypothetical protein
MVFFVLTRSGFDDVRPRIDLARDAVWINASVLSQSEVDELRVGGWNLTTFTNLSDLNDLASDIETIREHHPNEVVWAEAHSG